MCPYVRCGAVLVVCTCLFVLHRFCLKLLAPERWRRKKIEKESDRNKREIDRMKWNETKDRDYRKRKDRKNKINEIKERKKRKEMKEIEIGGRKKILKGRGEKEIDQCRE